MNRVKKIIAVLVVLMMLLPIIPVAAEGETALEIKDLLALDLFGNTEKTDRITKDINLPAEYLGAQLTWASSNSDVVAVIGEKGCITAPAENTDVTLTATIEKDGETETKEIPITVLLRNSYIVKDIDFEDGQMPDDVTVSSVTSNFEVQIYEGDDELSWKAGTALDSENSANKVLVINQSASDTTNSSSNSGAKINIAAPDGTRRFIVSMDFRYLNAGWATHTVNLIGSKTSKTIAKGTEGSNIEFVGASSQNFIHDMHHWHTITFDIDNDTLLYNVTVKERGSDEVLYSYNGMDFSANDMGILNAFIFYPYRKGVNAILLDNIKVQGATGEALTKTEGEHDMIAAKNGDRLAVRSTYNSDEDGNDLVYVFDNIYKNSLLNDNVLSLAKTGFVAKTEGNTFNIKSENVISSTVMGTPLFKLNGVNPATQRKSLTVSAIDAEGNKTAFNLDGNESSIHGNSIEVKEVFSILLDDLVTEFAEATLTYTFDRKGRVVLKSDYKVKVDENEYASSYSSSTYSAMEVGSKFDGLTSNSNKNLYTATNGEDNFTAVLLPVLDGFENLVSQTAGSYILPQGSILPSVRLPLKRPSLTPFISAAAFPDAANDMSISTISVWEYNKNNTGITEVDYAGETYLFFDFSMQTSFTYQLAPNETRVATVVAGSNVGDVLFDKSASTLTVTGDSSSDGIIVKIGNAEKTDIDEAREFIEKYADYVDNNGKCLDIDVEDTDYKGAAVQNDVLRYFIDELIENPPRNYPDSIEDIKYTLMRAQAISAFKTLEVEQADARLKKYNEYLGFEENEYQNDVALYGATEIGKAFRSDTVEGKINEWEDIKSIYDAHITVLKNDKAKEEEEPKEDTTNDNTMSDSTINLGGSGFGSGSGSSDKDDDEEEEKEDEPQPPAVSYKDLSASHWAYEYIEKLNVMNVIDGYEDGSFKPEESVTREQLVKMLVTALALKGADSDKQFTDVPADHWSESYIKVAASLGIISGYGDGSFKPQSKVTREDMAVIIKRALDAAGVSLQTENEAIAFGDAEEISDYAAESVNQISAFGIISGMGDNSFKPKGYLTRAQAAKVIYLVCEAK